MKDVLKEFLVALGFEVDEKKYKTAMKKIGDFEEKAGKAISSIAKTTVKGAAVTVTALASVTAGVAAYMQSVAQADIETEKFARRMWMTEVNARSLQNTLNAMGESMDTIYDVAANPELRDHFLRLRADAAKLEGGSEIEQGLKEIREFQFEFQRFKLLVSYASRYVAYYLNKYLSEPMAQFKAMLKSINDNGRSIAEEWGEKIAKGLSWIIRLFAAGAQGVADLIAAISRLPGEMKLALVAIAALGFAAMNPFTLMIAAIGAVLLLLDDFYTWQRGGKSLLGDTWSQLSNVDFGSKTFGSLKNLLGSVGESFVLLGEKWQELDAKVKESTGFTILEHVLIGIDTILSGIIDGLTSLIDLINSILKGEPPEWFKALMYGMGGTTEQEMLRRLNEYDEMEARRKEDQHKGRSEEGQPNIFKSLPNLMKVVPEMAPITLPIFGGPTAPAEQVKQVVSNDNSKDIKQENRMEWNNNFVLTGTDANAMAYGIASHLQQMILNQFSGGWINKALEIPE